MSTTASARILNVDDNEACRYAITRILQVHNFRVAEAANGSEALNKVREVLPDLVLLDVNLPDINGYEVCRRIKADPATARIPVLHLTATYRSGVEMARGLEEGAESYLIEPVDPDVLVATIKSVLRAKRAEEDARKLAIEWQTSMDAISDALALLDTAGAIRRCNRSFAKLVGREPAELAGIPCFHLSPNPPAAENVFREAISSGRRQQIEQLHNGRALRITVEPVLDETGGANGAVYILTDNTDTKRLEEQFRESQKFETIGTLAAGVAHDFNNLLTSIMGNASLALAGELTPQLRERLDEVVNASQRAADLTRQLLAYSGKGKHFVQRANLADIVRGVEHLIEAAVPKKVRLDRSFGAKLPAIEADVSQIQQLVLNLVSNAAEAIGDGPGVIRIWVRGEDGGVVLEVEDTGCGMTPEVQVRMFDPFFTTKFTGRGLGLAAVAGIVRTHKASIEVVSAPAQGSRFRIVFPPAERGIEGRSNAASAEVATEQGTVLVVDDEAMVRQVAQASLEVRGFRVLVANNGREAIEVAKAHPEITVVVLDLTMPVMSGEEALDTLLGINPQLRVLISTGYDSREEAVRLRRKQLKGYLQKPYTSRQLADQVREAFGDKSETGAPW
jgi:two-component system, cell cycle sensor histidine kinase and response regulator CckA